MRPRLVTFDCYGTLVDWNRGIADAFRTAAERDGVALDEVGGDPSRLLHIAGSYFHDIRPARELAIPAIWVNRGHDAHPPGPEPSFRTDGLDAAVDRVRTRTAGEA